MSHPGNSLEGSARVSSLADQMEHMLDRFPKGAGLIELDPETGSSVFLYANAKYCELSNSTLADLKEFGIPATGRSVPSVDRARVDPYVIAAAKTMSEWTISLRVCFEGGDFQWRRFIGTCAPGENGKILMSVSCEDFTEGARLMEASKSGSSASLMLSSFVTALFDASCYVDGDFRIRDDSPKLRYLLSSNVEQSVSGMSLISFIKLDEDKIRFLEYMSRAFLWNTQPVGAIPAAPMIRVRMALADGSLTDVQVYVTPTHVKTGDRFDSVSSDSTAESISGSSEPSVYLVGLRVMSDSQFEDIQAEEAFSILRTPISKSAKVLPLNMKGGSRKFAHALHRSVSRDLAEALKFRRNEFIDSNPNPNLPSFSWIVPLYSVCDAELMEEELVRALPNNIQWDFYRASQNGNFLGCGQFLAFSLEGDADLFRRSAKGSPELCQNVDLLHCTFRFFCDMVQRIGPEDGYELLYLLDEAATRMGPERLGLVGHEVVRLEITLALLTATYKNPQWFSCPESTDWLRTNFSSALADSNHEHLDKSKRLGTIYWVCALWGVVQNKLERFQESMVVLKNVYADMVAYGARHPEAASVRKLQAVIAHNLSVEFLKGGNVLKALKWAHKVQEIILTSQVPLHCRCTELVRWAERVQGVAEIPQFD